MDVYVFGTGASAPYGAPTMAGFLAKAYGPWHLSQAGITDIDNELQIVASTIDEQYGVNLKEALERGSIGSLILEKVNVEELLALADETKNNRLRQALERIIYKTIEDSIREKGIQRDLDREYGTLIKHTGAAKRDVCFISFNYDLLLDHALADVCHTLKLDWSYCLPFNASIEHFGTYNDNPNPKISLLKLHGSLNWLQCGNCGNLRLYYYISYDNLSRANWPACKYCGREQFHPVLVAPTPAKQIPLVLDTAWNRAAEYLERTDNVTIVGYSFSALDRKARALFVKHFIVPNLTSGSRPNLRLVIQDDGIRNMIKNWLLPAVDKHIEEYPTFEEFCLKINL